MSATFSLERIDFGFNHVKDIYPSRIEYGRELSSVGTLTINCEDSYPPELFFRNAMWRLYRQPTYGAVSLEPQALWFTRRVRHDHQNKQWIITALDQNWLLDQRIVAYRSQTTLGDKTFEEGNDGPIDDLMKAFVRENLGVDAVITPALTPDTDRDLSAYLEVAADESLAPDGEISGSFNKVIEVLNSLATQSDEKGTKVFFDIEVTSNGLFRFVTKLDAVGADRINDEAITISQEDAILDNLITDDDYSDEITAVYIGGQGSGGGKNIIKRVSDRSYSDPFNRVEAYFDLGGEYTDSYYEQQGDALLYGGRPRKRMTADLVDSDVAIYGRDIFYGDYVKVSADGNLYNCHISTVTNVVENGRENLRIGLTGEIVI